jgi:site-specific recombinase XerD
MKHIRIFLSFCYAENYTTELIHLKIKVPRAEKPVIEVLTDAEADALLSSCGADVLGCRNRAIISLMLDCGLRLSEVTGIYNTDINFENGYVKVMGKGRKGRVVPIGRNVREALAAYIRIRPNRAYKNLFLSIREKPLTHNGIIQLMNRMKREIPRLHAHLLRHTFATNFLLHGLGDIYELSRILGHSEIKTTEGYLQLASYYKILQNKTRQTYLDMKKPLHSSMQRL